MFLNYITAGTESSQQRCAQQPDVSQGLGAGGIPPSAPRMFPCPLCWSQDSAADGLLQSVANCLQVLFCMSSAPLELKGTAECSDEQ